MAIQREQNWLGQQRVDAPHLRSLESALCHDFDVLAGQVMAGSMPLVVTGFEIINPSASIGTTAASLRLNVAGGIVFHPNASESGTVFSVDQGAPVVVLDPIVSSNVSGSFTPSATNYIGIDLIRTADDSTADLVQFLDANSLQETPRIVPLGRTLNFRIIISTASFDTDSTILPIAEVVTNGSNIVSSIIDARNMMFSLSSGGSAPDSQYAYPWTQGRIVPNYFQGGDKVIGDQKSYFNALMTRLWELGGGEYWYSATSDRDVELAYGPPMTLGFGAQNFVWTGTNLTWAGLSLLFANSTATYNTITDNPTPGLPLADGQCLYVDVNRAVDGAAIVMQGPVALGNLGSPTVPGSRFVIAWMHGTNIFTRNAPYQLGRTFGAPASTGGAGGLGFVSLSVAAADPTDPVVIPLDTYGQCINAPTSGSNKSAFVGTGFGGGSGLVGTGDGLGSGVSGFGGTTTYGSGGYFVGSTNGNFVGGVGIYTWGGAPNAGTHDGGHGICSRGGAASGGAADGAGTVSIGGGSWGTGLVGLGGSLNTPPTNAGYGVYGLGATGVGTSIGHAGVAGFGGTGAAGQNGGPGGYFNGGAPGAGGSLYGPAISIGVNGDIAFIAPRTRNIIIPAQQMIVWGSSATFTGNSAAVASWNGTVGGGFTLSFVANIPVGSTITDAQVLCYETGGAVAVTGCILYLNYFHGANLGTQAAIYGNASSHGQFTAPTSLGWVDVGTPLGTNPAALTDGGSIQGAVEINTNLSAETVYVYAVQITYTQAEVAYNI